MLRSFRSLGRVMAVFGLMAPLAVLAWLWTDDRVRSLAQNTLLLTGWTVALSLLAGVPLALLLVRTNVAGRGLLGMLLLLLLFVPLYLQAAAWQAGFGVQGWYSLVTGSPAPLVGWPAVVWIHTVASIPWVVLIVALGLWFAEPELEEEALLNASRPAVFWRVTLPRAGAAIIAAGLWIAVVTAGEMTVTNLFLVRTYAEEVYTQIALGGEPGSAPWSMLPSVVATCWMILAGLVLIAPLIPYDRHTSQRAPHVFQLGAWRWPLSLLPAVVVLLLIGVPVAALMSKAGMIIRRTSDGWDRSWSLVQCLKIAGEAPLRFANEFGWSMLIGILAATGAVLFAIPLSWYGRRGGLAALPAWLVTAVCLAVPGPIVGLAIIWLFNTPDSRLLAYLYDRSVVAPWLAQMIKAFPLAILILWHSLSTMPNELLQSASMEGAGRATQLLRIVLPSRWPALAIAWLVGLAAAMADLAASILVVPPGVTTLSIRIFGLIHYGVDEYVAGICLALLVLFFLLGVAALAIIRWRSSRDS